MKSTFEFLRDRKLFIKAAAEQFWADMTDRYTKYSIESAQDKFVEKVIKIVCPHENWDHAKMVCPECRMTKKSLLSIGGTGLSELVMSELADRSLIE